MKSTPLQRLLSLVLTIAMLVQLVPMPAFADTGSTSAAVELSEEQPPTTIVGEEEHLRTEAVKHFRLSDGSYIAVSYGMPVHYQEEDGSWEDIDNTLTVETNAAGQVSYATAQTATSAQFSGTLATGHLFTASQGDVSVSMTLLNSLNANQMVADANAELITMAGSLSTGDQPISFNTSATAQIVSDEPAMYTLPESEGWTIDDLVPETLQSTLLYEDVYPGIDLEYTAYGYNIKEQIIVNTPQTSYRYDFFLELSGLAAVLNEDGSVSLLDREENQVYYIPAPFMIDDNSIISYDVTYELAQVEGGVVLTVIADSDWMNDEERAFPVKIDPTLSVDCHRYDKNDDDICTTYVKEGTPSEYGGNRQDLYTGYSSISTQKEYQAFVHFAKLPDVPAGAFVCDASLSMYLKSYTDVVFPEIPIGAYEVTEDNSSGYISYSSWIENLTWNRKPAFDSTNLLDYVIASSGKLSTYLTWNLSELVKQWYAEDETSCTIALVAPNADECNASYCAVAVFNAWHSIYPPVFLVSYRNNTGIESYYSYAGLGAGNAGAAYVADATGQLKVVNQVASYASTVNPFSLNLVYNSDYFAADNTVDYQTPEKLGLSMRLGSGWTLDAIQYVEKETISDIEYIRYHDGDGTVHYFPKNTSDGLYYDEDGLGLKIEATSSTVYTMSDDKDNTWTFTNGYLTATTDVNGNQILINYSNGKITSIQQKNNGISTENAITVATFTYSENYVSTITDAAGYITTLNYDSGKLTGITYQNSNIAAYTYDGYRIKTITDPLNSYALDFTYSYGKVASYREIGGDTNGAGCDITYPNYSETVYRDYGLDRTVYTNDDILTHYLFDNWGRTANAFTTDASGNVLGASNAAYTANNGSDRTNNRTLRSASIGVAGQQLMKDFGFEAGSSGTAWSLSSGTSYSATVSTTKPRTGQYSVKVNTGSSVTATVSAARSSNSLTAGKTYTLSAYVNTTGITAFNGNGIYLQVKDSSGNTWKSNYLNYKTVDTMDNGWVRISVTFTAKVTGAHTVGIYSNKSVGTFYADDFQLETGEAPSNTNLLENGNMSTADYGWTLSESASYSDGTLMIAGDPLDDTTNASQTVKINLPGSQTYVLSGWVNANAVPDNLKVVDDAAQDTVKQFGLRAVLTYSDNTVEYHYVPFNPDLTERQFVSYTIVPKEENQSKTLSTIQVVCAYEKNANIACFDDISLVREAAQTLKYDPNGNLVSVTTSGLNKDTNEYSDENNNLIKTVTSGNGTYEYTYDDKHRLTGVKVMNLSTSDENDALLTQAMVYDAFGNVVDTTLTGTSNRTLNSSAEYSDNGNLIVSTTDSSGNTTSYSYAIDGFLSDSHQMFGVPSTITDAKGTVTSQTIDVFGRQTNVSVANTSQVDYNYTGSLLSTIARKDIGADLSQSYTFDYDDFGNMIEVSAGEYTLAEYEYGPKNGPLAQQTYGNSATVCFAYDNLGRNKTTTYSGGRTLTYAYTGDGQLYSINDNTLGKYVYTYDTLGRLIASQRFNTSGGFVMGTNQTYNANNQLVGQSWKIGTAAFSDTYSYNSSDGSIASQTVCFNGTQRFNLTYNYDYLRRLSSITGGINAREYTYSDISDTQTTTQVSALTYPNLGTPLTFQYTYDALGNIVAISDPMPLSGNRTYEYDTQGQLLKETIGSTVYEYTYDGFGNLLTANGHEYTYGNTSWRDLLTAYDGQTIEYDGSGNPTSYYNGTRWIFGWAEGRNLVTAQTTSDAEDISVTYSYDHNGVRTGKTVVTQAYHVHDYTETVTSPTCTTVGFTTYTCTCGDSYVSNETSATGHSYSESIVESTCTESGYTVYTCSVCGHSYQGNTTAETGHTYVSTVIAPTCTETGYTIHTCSVCGHSYQDNEFDATGHNYSTETVAATCTTAGYIVYTCTICDHSFQASWGSAALGHHFNLNNVCTRCGYRKGNGDIVVPIIPPISGGTTSSQTDTATYTSDASAERVLESTTTEATDYYYASGKLLRQVITTTTTTVAGETETTTDTLDFFYDASGQPYAVKYNDNLFYYVLNLQGDVVRIVNSSGTSYGIYNYDAWGNILYHTDNALLNANPLRYRGYVYDSETELYYLQSRYYDPQVGRFINADAYASTGQGLLGNNMFAYCLNNPVNYHDRDGQDAIWIQEANSAGPFGHSGLLVQDGEGNWWYFYWGPIDPNAFFLSMCFYTDEICVFIDLGVQGSVIKDAEDVRAVLQNCPNASDTRVGEQADDITRVLYLEGDYTNTFLYLSWLSDPNTLSNPIMQYSLLANNCSQQTVRALAMSNPAFWLIDPLIPNNAFRQALNITGFQKTTSKFPREVAKL